MPACSPTPPNVPLQGLRAAGRWFRNDAGQKVILRGVTYGPFRPDDTGCTLPATAQLQADLTHIRRLGFNTIRVYELPDRRMLDACALQGLQLIVGIPWMQHVDFLTDKKMAKAIAAQVRSTAEALAHEPSVSAIMVGNEIEKTLVRWMEPDRVREFLEKLIRLVKEVAPEKMVAYASYPSTEYLIPRNADFVSFNVFLEEREAFRNYLQRLHVLAGDKPLVISEFGLDTKQNGVERQAELYRWQWAEMLHSGVAGSCWFAYTDEWYRGGEDVLGWDFGLVTRDRQEKPVCAVVKETVPSVLRMAPRRFSVIICTRNGSKTLRECLETTRRINYPDFEVLIIDDGSTDSTPEIAREFPEFRYHRQEHAGLGAARNLGMQMATGEFLAYTDDDCMPDEDWLTFLNEAYEDPTWVAAGGPNIPPPPRNEVERVVASAPGGPSHVLMDSYHAEHLPGCNLSIRRDALLAVGGFGTQYRAAGDDVDVCWKLMAAGGRLRFAPAAMVWHHRRFEVKAYFRQQRGYGHAEALLIKAHPERFAWFGGARWKGMIYGTESPAGNLGSQVIYHGHFGLAPFQCVYASWERRSRLGLYSLLLAAVTGLLCYLSQGTHFERLGSLVFVYALLFCVLLTVYRLITWITGKTGCSNRPLLFFLQAMQPWVRNWARYRSILSLRAWPEGRNTWRRISDPQIELNPRTIRHGSSQHLYWSSDGADRQRLLAVLSECAADSPFTVTSPGAESRWDLIVSRPGVKWLLKCVTEYHAHGGCLTRVHWQPYKSSQKAWFCIGLAILLGWILSFVSQAAFVIVFFATLIVPAVLDATKLNRWIRQSAQKAGMIPVSHKDTVKQSTIPVATPSERVSG